MIRYMKPVGTIYRRALKRVYRRAARWRADPTDANRALLVEACRLANRLSAGVRW